MGIIYSIDYSILLFLQEHIRNDILTGIFKFITMLGNGGWFWIVLSLLLLINKKDKKNRLNRNYRTHHRCSDNKRMP